MKKILSISFILLLLCIVAAVPASASSEGGLHDGVYLIYDAADLVAFAEYVNGDITHVATDAKLMGDIDLSGVAFAQIGTASNQYSGTFDGDGWKIMNLNYFDYHLSSALHLIYGTGATVKNVHVENVSLNKTTVHNIATNSDGRFTIFRCSVADTIYFSNITFDNYPTQIISNRWYITNCIETMGDTPSVSNVVISNFYTSGQHQCLIWSNNAKNILVNGGSMYGGGSGNPSSYSGMATIAYNGNSASDSFVNISNIYGTAYSKFRIGTRASNSQREPTITNCYASDTSYVNGVLPTSRATKDNLNGQTVSSSLYHDKRFYDGTGIDGTVYLSWDFDTVWYWDETELLPKLIIFGGPLINSVTQTSSGLAAAGYNKITATCDAESQIGNPLSYVWYYSTNSGATWTAATQASATPEVSFTPQTAGTYTIKVVITDTERGFSIDSYGQGYTNLVTTVLPTYTPQSVITKTSSVESKTADNYQAKMEFDFRGDVKAAEWLANDNAYVAAGNAVYNVIGNKYEIEPVAEWTGNNISAAYLGNTRAIINDIDNNVAVYTYETGEAQYITASGSDLIAVTDNYAGVISGGTLNIYNLQTGKLQASITTSSTSSAATLQANDKTDVFVTGYGTGGNRVYLHYYVINGNTITEKTLDPLYSFTPFKIIKQVRGTSNWIVNYDTYIYKMYLLNITNTQASTIFASAAERAYTIAQATESNAIIAANGDRAYLIAADGKDIGSYETGGTVNDVSIAKSNGLYAVFGGDDNQVYFLNKRDTQSWIVGQTTDFLENVKYSQVSTKGTFVLVGTETNKMFLLEWDENVESNFFINGVVINGNGQPYANKYITIDAHSVQTDDNGFFVYPVKPGTTYTISAGSTTVRYTATNQGLQPLAITLKSHLVEQDVTYSATYNKTSGNIVMRYNDAAALTSSVKWTVRDTKTNTVVHEQTVSAGQESFYFVPTDKQNDNYYVQVTADREDSASVKNTWSITPSGTGHEVNLFGMDETGRNILFGFFLIVLTGLFGYMHQHVGCIIVAFAALLLRFLGLITIPWIVIIIASVLAVVAAIARRGEGK